MYAPRFRNADRTTLSTRTTPGWILQRIWNALPPIATNDGFVKLVGETFILETEAGDTTVFVAVIQPQPRLAIVGSGHDVAPVAELGSKNGFHVEVVGFRGRSTLKLGSRRPTNIER